MATITKETLVRTVDILVHNSSVFHAWANKLQEWSKDKDGRGEEIKQLRLMGEACDRQAEKIREVLREME